MRPTIQRDGIGLTRIGIGRAGAQKNFLNMQLVTKGMVRDSSLSPSTSLSSPGPLSTGTASSTRLAPAKPTLMQTAALKPEFGKRRLGGEP